MIDVRVVGEETVQDVVDVIDCLDGAVEVCTQPHGVVFDADLSNADDAVVIPSGFLSGEFDFEAGDAVALYPVGEDHGIAVVGFIACAFRVVEEVVAAYGMPCGQAVWARADEVVFGIVAGEREVFGGFEVVGEVGVHEVCVVRVVDVGVVAYAISVVEGEVVCRCTDERGEAGHVARGFSLFVVEVRQEVGEDVFLECVADFYGMAGGGDICPGASDFEAEVFHGGFPDGIREVWRWPCPGRAQGCFSPAASGVAQPVFDVDADSYAGDAVELFGAKAIGYARLDGEEVGGDGFDFYVCWFGHGFVSNVFSRASKNRSFSLCEPMDTRSALSSLG